MARTASTIARKIETEVSVIDFVYYIARNGGQMLTEQQIGNILFQNQAQVMKAMREAAVAYLKPIVDNAAGILPREISDAIATAELASEENGKKATANGKK